MLPNQGRGSQWSRGEKSRGTHASHHRTGIPRQQQFSNPYQDCRNNPNEWSTPRQPFNHGARGTHYQTNRGWQNSGRPHSATHGQAAGFCNKNNQSHAQQQDVDIRNYVIPAMTDNPWKHLEEQWNTEHSSATIE
ncbi:hypothetical protein KIN20_031756 [Parelaphostrongylus tenuis]|uniref:Uncharacterized protein n=1 Tax=Parelaphostrongylus tenuis TaxID=148309 RepID=A0AAD5WHZ0_PARTN|nr:hypothetical protein KIN20_031756 [Parelaphostrongylus tenuis]